jgi:hypothetical protein
MADKNSQMMFFGIQILVFVAMALVVFYASRYQHRKLKAKLDAIAMSLGGEVVTGVFSEHYVKLIGSEWEQRIQFIMPGKNTPPYLVLKQFSDLDFDLHITRENAVTKFAERLGLPIEIQIGDPMFDDKYLIMSRSKEKAANFLMSSERRQILDEFFANGFDNMALQAKMVSFRKPSYSDQDLDPSLLRARLEQVRKFISG